MQPTAGDVDEFLASVDHKVRQADGFVLREMMERITGCPAVMWGPTIVGFDRYHYKYDSGHEGESFMVGFSPRKAKHSLYFMPGYGEYDEIVSRLGKSTSGKACLYINKLADIDMSVLEELTATAIETMRKKYPA